MTDTTEKNAKDVATLAIEAALPRQDTHNPPLTGLPVNQPPVSPAPYKLREVRHR